jgi:hypothetical protein
MPGMNDNALQNAHDIFQAKYTHLTLDDTLRYDHLKGYLDRYKDADAQNWLGEALLTLMNTGPASQGGGLYIINNHVEIRITEFKGFKKGMGVRWAADGAIEMRADRMSWTAPLELFRLPGLAHEAKHLEQGKRIALTKLGEVQAWSIESQVRQELRFTRGHIPAEVDDWAADPTKENFHKASKAIIASQPRTYFFWLLPPYPYFASYQTNLERLP